MKKFLIKNATLVLAVFIVIFAIAVRSFGLTEAPPSLYWEEAALGYDAYSILKTGKDHHGNSWPIVAFESFGDWKPSLYFYSLVSFIQVFGLEPWVVRLPSVISGILIVIGIGLLSYKSAVLLSLKKPQFFAVLGLFIAAISTWAIHFSRGGWEVNLATCLITWSVVTGLFVVRKQKKLTTLSMSLALITSVLLSLAIYAYHGTRLIAPMIGVLLAGYWFSELNIKKSLTLTKIAPILASGFLALVLISPVLISIRSPQVSQRFAETSIFSQLSVIEKSNALKETSSDTFLSKILFHRYLLFSKEIISNYFDHFNFNFLFISGDINPRHSSSYAGHLYYQEFFLILFGIGLLINKRKKIGWILILWWLTAIIPASLTKTTPHALRILPAMPAILTISSLGCGQIILLLIEQIKARFKLRFTVWPFFFLVAGVYLITFTVWWRHYMKVYPQQQSYEWQYGYQQMVSQVKMARELNIAPVYITREQGRPAMYYWFFSKTNPELVQSENTSAQKDQGEYLTFQNITFPNTVEEIDFNQEKVIVASSDQQMELLVKKNIAIEKLATITNPLGEIVWQVYTVNSN